MPFLRTSATVLPQEAEYLSPEEKKPLDVIHQMLEFILQNRKYWRICSFLSDTRKTNRHLFIVLEFQQKT